jgi:hypothetical protein
MLFFFQKNKQKTLFRFAEDRHLRYAAKRFGGSLRQSSHPQFHSGPKDSPKPKTFDPRSGTLGVWGLAPNQLTLQAAITAPVLFFLKKEPKTLALRGCDYEISVDIMYKALFRKVLSPKPSAKRNHGGLGAGPQPINQPVSK